VYLCVAQIKEQTLSNMLILTTDKLTEIFVEVDDFIKEFQTEIEKN
jgi:hypothetical protein